MMGFLVWYSIIVNWSDQIKVDKIITIIVFHIIFFLIINMDFMSLYVVLLFQYNLIIIIEEMVKIIPLTTFDDINIASKEILAMGAMSGLLFSTFENMSYIFVFGKMNYYRVLLTTPLHIITAMISSYGLSQKSVNSNWFLYVITSSILHKIFNILTM